MSQLQQGTSTTGFQYDNDNRRTLLTLANGVTVTYGYDGDLNLSSLTYKNGARKFGGNSGGNSGTDEIIPI
ncbi:MAG TPA: RHS repeat domain-containing protein [Candidatus Koribacter sp.]